jgi:hypothetical protein
MRFQVYKKSDAIAQDLRKKLIQSPALGPYIVAQISGIANIKIAVPGILDGKVPGFGVDTGETKRLGLKAIFSNPKTGFVSRLWTPLFNIFIPGTKKGIKPVPLLETFDTSLKASGISQSVIEKALDDFDKNKIPDINKYLLLGIRKRK